MDKILLRGVRLDVHLGVPPIERGRVQQVSADIDIYFDTRRAGESDHFTHTIDYAAVHQKVKAVAEERPHALVEALAERIAAAILDGFPAAAVRVLIRKPEALREQGVEFAGVEILRERHG